MTDHIGRDADPAPDAPTTDTTEVAAVDAPFAGEAPPARPTPLHRTGVAALAAWRWFAGFRRTRPFWGGAWMMFGGWTIMSLTFAPVAVVVKAGLGGMAGYLLGGGLIVFGLTAWFAPRYRHLAGILGVMFAVASLVASNLGGFLIGMLAGIVGGSITFGWGEKKSRAPRHGKHSRAAAETAEGTEPEERA